MFCELHLQNRDEQVHDKVGPCDDEGDVVDEGEWRGGVHSSVHHEVPSGQGECLVRGEQGKPKVVVARRVDLGGNWDLL